MKGTDCFKSTLRTYLEYRASTDELFAVRYANPQKNLDDCVTYILNEVQRSECNGFADDEIYSMALHYYDEEDIEVGKPVNCRVVVNHVVELTAEEKEQAHRNALKRAEDEAYARMMQRQCRHAAKPQDTESQMQSLF